jgi:hypothetical protein
MVRWQNGQVVASPLANLWVVRSNAARVLGGSFFNNKKQIKDGNGGDLKLSPRETNFMQVDS